MVQILSFAEQVYVRSNSLCKTGNRRVRSIARLVGGGGAAREGGEVQTGPMRG